MTENNKNNDIISILDIILVLVKNKAMIFLITFCAVIIIVGISLLSLILPAKSPFNFIPNVYRPEVKILISLPGEKSGTLSSLAGSSEFGALLGLMGGDSVTQGVGEFVESLFELNEIRDKIIEEFDFIQKYNITNFPITNAREEFENRFTLNMNSENTILTIGYEDTDPQFATKVLNRTITEVVFKYTEITRSNKSKKLTFLEDSLELTEKNYTKLQDEFIAFQKEYGIIDISTQAEQSILYIAKLQAELSKQEIEVKKLLEYYQEDDPKVVRKKKEIETAKQVITEAENGIGNYSGQFLPKSIIPELTREYLNLELELNIQAAIYKMLREQYEAARIEELDTTNRFQILESAEVPEKKFRPSRGILCIIVTLFAFLFSVIVAFIREYLKGVKKNPREREKLSYIKTEFNILKFLKRKKE